MFVLLVLTIAVYLASFIEADKTQSSIDFNKKTLVKLTEDLKSESTGFTKKEILKMGIQRDKLERSLGGISEMKKIPDMIFIIDTNIEELAVKEALKLHIPIVAIVDTNSDPTGINYPIPGNDDARRAINLYCDLIKQTVNDAKGFIKENTTKDIDTDKAEDSNAKQKIEVKEKTTKPQIDKKKPSKKSVSIFDKIKNLTSKK